MPANDPIEQFNHRLDEALGLETAGALAQPDPETQALLAVAARLADSGLAGEARPSRALQARLSALPARHAPAPRALARRWLLPAALGALTLVLALALVGPGRVLAALERWLGYVPGVGVVEDAAALRVLAEPVAVEREGITLRVKQAVVDAQQTVILYEAEGLSIAAANSQGEGAPTGGRPRLRLPDGTLLEVTGGQGGGWGSGYEARLVFPALPPSVDTAVLEIDRLESMPAGAAPEHWELAVRFVPAPADMVVLPVLELRTPTPPAAATQAQAVPTATLAPPLHGLSLHLDRLVTLADGYLLDGHLAWDARFPAFEGAGPRELRLLDASGQAVPVERDYSQPQTGSLAYQAAWSLRTAGVYTPGPITVSLESVQVRLPEEVLFVFDPGADPRLGQTWDVAQTVEVLGYAVTIHAARFMRVGDLAGFEFELEAPPDLLALDLRLADHRGGSSGGGSTLADDGRIRSFALSDMRLGGPVRLAFHSAALRGPWTATVTPPAGSQPALTATPSVEPCLTLPEWKALVAAGPVPLPVGGRVVAYGALVPNEWGLFTANLDGSDVRVIGAGVWPALSPDGQRVAYAADDGLYVGSAAGGPGTRLPNTQANDYDPRWSPDGQQLAFVRVADPDLYVINPDGSGLRQVTNSPDYEQLIAWSPDGTRLYYTVMVRDNRQQLKTINVETGVITDLFSMGYRGVPALSPDGRRLAFFDDVFGEMGGALFVSRPDGSERKLLAQLDYWGIGNAVWSTDGAWLLLGVYDGDQMAPNPTGALLNPDTCEVVALPGLSGEVFGWTP